MHSVVATAFPRAGLLGNPSDLYGGRGIGFTFEDYAAEVRFLPANESESAGSHSFELGASLTPSFSRDPEIPILQATRRVLGELGLSQGDQSLFQLQVSCDIPRQVGLSGSSAIILAALRAVCAGIGLQADVDVLAALALRVETDFMDIAAGPMDRIVQSYGGLVAMDFELGKVERIDSALMPPIAILIDRSPGQDSGSVHSPVRERWEAGDSEVRAVMAEFRPLVEHGLRCLRTGDIGGLRQCVDRNFDLRAMVFPISDRDRAVIDLVRSCGAAAKFCGSGGAILALHEDPGLLDEICLQIGDQGFEGIRPRITEVVA